MNLLLLMAILGILSSGVYIVSALDGLRHRRVSYRTHLYTGRHAVLVSSILLLIGIAGLCASLMVLTSLSEQ